MEQTLSLLLTPFERAVASLEEILQEPKTIIVRDATVQRFEYTFELAIKMMKRVLESFPDGGSVDQLSFRDLCRMAAESGLISRPEAWFAYRDARNETSHAYDEAKAELVYDAAHDFAKDARLFLEALKKRV